MNFFQVREKSENFTFSQGHLEKNGKKVMTFLKNPKKGYVEQASESYNLYKLHAVYIQKHFFSNILGFSFSFNNLKSS